MQLTLAFMSYATFSIYEQYTASHGSAGPITSHLVAHSANLDHKATSLDAVTEFEPLIHISDLSRLFVPHRPIQKQQATTSDSSSSNTQPSSANEPYADTDSTSGSSQDTITATALPKDGPEASGSLKTGDEFLHADCVGHKPLATPKQYPIRYPLNDTEYPLADGVYSNCKVSFQPLCDMLV